MRSTSLVLALLALATLASPAGAQTPPTAEFPPTSSAQPAAPAPSSEPVAPTAPAYPPPPPQSAVQPTARPWPTPYAPPYAAPAPAEQKLPHTGLFLRLHGGPARYVAKFAPDPDGIAGAFGLMLGGTPIQGLAVHGHLHFVSGGEDGVFMGQVGAGFTYYHLPLNAYATLMLGSGSGNYPGELGTEIKTSKGITYDASIGKEWDIGGAWGLGPALQLWYTDLDEGAYRAIAVVLSATLH